MGERLCLLTVHAHPDDEASKGAGSVARYHTEGVRTVLVCCTGGEAGDILNQAMGTPEGRARLPAHDIAVRGFEAAGDPDAYPEAGDPWQPSKLYYTAWSRARIEATHEKMLELGLESPFSEDWFKRPSQDDRITTKVDITDYY